MHPNCPYEAGDVNCDNAVNPVVSVIVEHDITVGVSQPDQQTFVLKNIQANDALLLGYHAARQVGSTSHAVTACSSVLPVGSVPGQLIK